MKHKPIIVALVIFIIAIVCTSLVMPEADEGHTKHIVKRGETLWSIADELTDNADIRAVVFDIKKASGMKNADIFAGDVLLIPNKYLKK